MELLSVQNIMKFAQQKRFQREKLHNFYRSSKVLSKLTQCYANHQLGSPVVAFRAGGTVSMEMELPFFSGPVERFIGINSGRINLESDLGVVWKSSVIDELIQTL